MKQVEYKAFTLAEILVTLTIIGVIAAMLFPSILANYTERSLTARRAAFVARMSQAMGELADRFADFDELSCIDPNNVYTCSDVGSALKFLNEGLGKNYKIASTCDAASLEACDIPDTITRQDGELISLYDITENFEKYTSGNVGFGNVYAIALKSIIPAAFTTKNGESALIFYNPTCQNKNNMSIGHEALMCANMIFDLNGAKGKPNKIGEDIWFLTSFYAGSPYVVAPKVYDFNKVAYTEDASDASGNPIKTFFGANLWGQGYNHSEIAGICGSLGENVVMPSYEEASSILMNLRLLTDTDFLKSQAPTSTGGTFTQRVVGILTSTMCGKNLYKAAEADWGTDWNDDYCGKPGTKKSYIPVCVYENSAQ